MHSASSPCALGFGVYRDRRFGGRCSTSVDSSFSNCFLHRDYGLYPGDLVCTVYRDSGVTTAEETGSFQVMTRQHSN